MADPLELFHKLNKKGPAVNKIDKRRLWSNSEDETTDLEKKRTKYLEISILKMGKG